MKRNCPDDKDNQNKENKVKDKKFDKDGKIIGAVIDDDGSEDSVCMCATNEDSVICTAVEQRTFLMLDGGADEHCCRRDFIPPNIQLAPTNTKLRDVQMNPLRIDGTAETPFVVAKDPSEPDGELLRTRADFITGPSIQRNLLSVGKLYDGGFDIVISKRLGTYMGKMQESGNYERMELSRRRNIFGIEVEPCASREEAKLREKKSKGVIAAAVVAPTNIEEPEQVANEDDRDFRGY
jgi:hypothetical protein